MRSMDVLLVASLIILAGCADQPTSSHNATTIYFTSFERASDTAGWHGISSDTFVRDAAPLCGRYAAWVYGGCLQPAAWITLGPFETDGEYTFSGWAKALDDLSSEREGIIIARLDTLGLPDTSILAAVTRRFWTPLGAQGSIFCPAGQRIQLQVQVGGIIARRLLIDGLTVSRLED